MADWQETVAVPKLVTLVGDIVPQVRPAGTVSVRETTPAKPFTAVIVTAEVAELLIRTAPGELAAMVKSVTVNVAVAAWTVLPLVPVIVRT